MNAEIHALKYIHFSPSGVSISLNDTNTEATLRIDQCELEPTWIEALGRYHAILVLFIILIITHFYNVLIFSHQAECMMIRSC